MSLPGWESFSSSLPGDRILDRQLLLDGQLPQLRNSASIFFQARSW